MKKIISVLLLVVSAGALADPFSSSAQAAQLAELVRQAKIQLEEVRKQLSVMENMKELQQMDAVRELTETGDALGQMFGDIRAMEREVEDWRDDPAGTRQIENDIDRLTRSFEGAEGERALDKGQTYSGMMSSLSRMKWLGKAQAENEKKLAAGSTKKEDEKMAASAALSTNRILLEQEMARQRREVIGTEVFMETMKNVDYGNMGLLK